MNMSIFNREGDDENQSEILRLLQQISNNSFVAGSRIAALEETYFALFPYNGKSIDELKVENLVKMYTAHLVKHKKLSSKDADLRARFEVAHYDSRELLREIDSENDSERRTATKEELLSSSFFKKEIEDFYTTGNINSDERWIAPYDLFAPVYMAIQGDRCTTADILEIDYDNNYYDFIKYRAIVRKLLSLGILREVTRKTHSGKELEPGYKLTSTDLDEIKITVYGGPDGHDNTFFAERLQERGGLPRIFSRDIFSHD